MSELFNTLQVYLGSYYVNNFNEFGRTWQVNVQADQSFRDQVPAILQLQVRNTEGQMIRLATLMEVRNTSGPVMVQRYNMYSSAAITGNAMPGTSSGEAIALMQEIAERELPRSMAYDWTELAFIQREAGEQPSAFSGWRWYLFSLFLRHNTKAGSCRWRSFSWCRCASCARSSRLNGPGST